MEKNGQIHQRMRSSLNAQTFTPSQPKEEKKEEIKVKPVLCDKGHALEYFNGVPEAYRLKYGMHISVNCNPRPLGCSKGSIREGYNCPICEFDLCMDCYRKYDNNNK
jgi:hypothetical protein